MAVTGDHAHNRARDYAGHHPGQRYLGEGAQLRRAQRHSGFLNGGADLADDGRAGAAGIGDVYKRQALKDAKLDELVQKIVFTREELNRNQGKPCYLLEFYTGTKDVYKRQGNVFAFPYEKRIKTIS